MSRNLPTRPRIIPQAGSRIAIVASEYNGSWVEAMLKQTKAEILEIDPSSQVEVIRAPGSFEIPLLVQLVVQRHRPAAVIALGVILRGETLHGEFIARSVTDSLQRLALKHTLPVINGVLFLDNEEQARARCHPGPLNRGTEAARAAISAIRAIRDLQPR